MQAAPAWPGVAPMIAALERLNSLHPQPLPDKWRRSASLGGGARGIKRLFMTHPPLAERIAALKASVGR